MNSAMHINLWTLPNELLLHILTSLQTRYLLRLTLVSRRFHNLVLRIIRNRLLIAANITEHTLILECYHTSAKFTEPPLFCQYLGTDGLDSGPATETDVPPSSTKDVTYGKLGQLAGLYSRFLPRRKEVEVHPLRRHPAGDIPGSRTHPSSLTGGARHWMLDDLVSQVVTLESHELFSQLCAQTNLAKAGPRNGLFLSLVEVSDGVIRIFRDWLARQAENHKQSSSDIGTHSAAKGKGRLREEDEDRILWVNDGKNVGLRLRVKERKWNRENPILLHRDEEVAVSYTIQFEGESSCTVRYIASNNPAEVLVRTTHLLLMMERSLVEQLSHSGKAIVFGSFG